MSGGPPVCTRKNTSLFKYNFTQFSKNSLQIDLKENKTHIDVIVLMPKKFLFISGISSALVALAVEVNFLIAPALPAWLQGLLSIQLELLVCGVTSLAIAIGLALPPCTAATSCRLPTGLQPPGRTGRPTSSLAPRTRLAAVPSTTACI